MERVCLWGKRSDEDVDKNVILLECFLIWYCRMDVDRVGGIYYLLLVFNT